MSAGVSQSYMNVEMHKFAFQKISAALRLTASNDELFRHCNRCLTQTTMHYYQFAFRKTQ